MNKLVNAREAGKLLGVCTQTIYQKFEQGSIPGYRMGKAVRFDVPELKALMRKQAISSIEKRVKDNLKT